MKLSIFERLILLAILPKEGNFVTLKIIKTLRESLSPTEEEIKLYKFVEDKEKGKVTWDLTVDQFAEIEISELASGLVVETLKKLDKELRLTEQHIGLYEKFILEGGKKDG